MNKAKFKHEGTYLPVSPDQFQSLANELLVEMNKVAHPHFFDGEYFAQVLMHAIHARSKKDGYVRKSDLFNECINRISCHVTFNLSEEIQARIKAKKLEEKTTTDETTEELDTLPLSTHTDTTQLQ